MKNRVWEDCKIMNSIERLKFNDNMVLNLSVNLKQEKLLHIDFNT